MRLMNELLDELNIKTVLSYARAAQPRNYVGPTLFPTRNTNELTFEYWKDENLLPVMAKVQAYGAETPIASREGVEKVKGEIPPIKRKINLDERYLIALKREGLGDKDIVKNAVFNDLDKMIKAVNDRIEALRIEAITTGKLTLAENGVIMNVDYGVPDDHKDTLETTALWTATTTAEPITNILEWVDQIVSDTGIRPTRALTSNTVVANMLKNDQIRELIHGSEGSTRAVSLPMLNNLLAGMGLPTVATYDLKTRIEAANGTLTTSRLFLENMFVLLPPDPLGETLYGPTAEALMSDAGLNAQEIAGMFASVYGTQDPPSLWTKVAATAIPTMPMADAIFLADVIDLS